MELNAIPSLWIFILLFRLTMIQLLQPYGVSSELICSDQPIIALAGDDVILPCQLQPAVSVSSETLLWIRPGLDLKYIHVQRAGCPMLMGPNPSYYNRTALFVDQLMNGNVSLKLFRVKLSDAGRYTCIIDSKKMEASVQLTVGAASTPVVNITGIDRIRGGVVLQCESTGWYPEPEVLWLDGEGNLLSAGPTETVRAPDDLYTVSSRVTVEKRHSNSFTCRVQQNHINQTRETHIHVPDDFFAGPSGSSSSLPVIIGLILSIVFFLIAAAAAVVVWKWRQNKIRNKKQREDEEGGNSPELKLLMGGDTDGKQPTEETEKVNNVDEFRGEPGQTETDEETLQQEANNAQCADREGTELQFTQEAGGQTTRETETGLDQSQEETETEAVTETDSLHPVSTNLNNKDIKTVTMVEERQKDNNQQTAEKKGAQSLKDKDKHGEQQTAERETLRDREKENLKKKLKTKEREEEKSEEQVIEYEGHMKDKEKQINEVKQQLEEVKRQTEDTERTMRSEKKEDKDFKLLSVLNKKEEELQEQLEKLETQLEGIKKSEIIARQKKIKCAAAVTEAQSLTEEDKHGEQQTAERETLRDREKEHLKKKLKTKERELEKIDRYVSRYEGQIKDKEKQINEVKQQLEEVKRQTEETERKMRSEKEEDYKLLSVLNRKEEELQEQLEKLETQLEGIKKSEIMSRERKIKTTNENEETKEQEGIKNSESLSIQSKRRRI